MDYLQRNVLGWLDNDEAMNRKTKFWAGRALLHDKAIEELRTQGLIGGVGEGDMPFYITPDGQTALRKAREEDHLWPWQIWYRNLFGKK